MLMMILPLVMRVFQKKILKIYSNPLFDFDDKYISSDINPLFNEVLEDIESKDSYVSNLDKPAWLVTPLFDANEDECFDPGGDFDEIDDDIPPDFEDGYHDLEGNRIYLESLLIDEPDNDDLKSMVIVFDPRIHEKIISPTYVRLPFEDRWYQIFTKGQKQSQNRAREWKERENRSRGHKHLIGPSGKFKGLDQIKETQDGLKGSD
ncbi:hypothetical protein Tco_0606930 [Tanacetum coccineum]